MPDTPNFAISYPCMSTAIVVSAFCDFATDVENAIATVDAEATAVLHTPYAYAISESTAAAGAETTMIFTTFAAGITSSGITVNAAAGTFTIVTPGSYVAAVFVSANQATLTMTSQRVAVFVNGALQAVRKYRGTNPVTVGALSGSYSVDLHLAAGDVVTYRYLWTGTGALNGLATAHASLSFLGTP
jgi:hypothetical protein